MDKWEKLFERLILARLEEAFESSGGLAANPFGFQKGMGTCNALRMVFETVKQELQKPPITRGICVLVNLDVKNAFNCAV